jgi:ADP-ribosyl-[dinitrogen reductase] hydrolase
VTSFDRAAGVLLGLAAGDALGAGYEFSSPPSGEAEMIGGGLGSWEEGEWTDDTQMALCIAEEAATGVLSPGNVGDRFLDWYRRRPKDIGVQTAAVLSRASSAAELPRVAEGYYERNPRHGAGNGSLMRTAPVALAALGDDEAIFGLARKISGLTHADPLAEEACALWCIGIDRAVREGRLDGVLDGLALLEPSRRGYWAGVISEARERPAREFRPNGFVVKAFQAALAAVLQAPVPATGPPCLQLQRALQAAVKVGDDTDTVAAIAGSLLGARWGSTAVPTRWRQVLHGWPGYRAGDLVRLGALSAWRGRPDRHGWPTADDLTPYYASNWPAPPLAVALREDPGVFLANVFAVEGVGADVVVSLCRVGRKVPTAPLRVEIGLVDDDDLAANPNLDFIFADVAESICSWRSQGRTVALHCVQAERRTPAVAAAYLAQRFGTSGEDAWARVAGQLPVARPNPAFHQALRRLWPASGAKVAG